MVNLATGVPATPTVAFASDGTLVESAANGTIGLANLYIPLNFKNAYVSSWNFAVQQSLRGDMTLQMAYGCGTTGRRIDVAQNINQPLIYGQSGSYDPLNVAFGKTAAVTQYFLGYSTNYESLQVQLTRRMTQGLAFNSSYTWGKAENYGTGAQDGNLLFWSGPVRRNYNVADFDRTNNFEQTVTYELPAGVGHHTFNSGPTAYVLGGWKLSGILSLVSGLPFTITTSSATPGTTQTVNQTGPYQVTHNVVGAANVTWFNPASFVAPPTCVAYSASNPVACALGGTQRNQFRGPAYMSNNLSLFKSFPIHGESAAIEARFDAFNMTNTPAFNGLPTSALGSNLGKITATLGSGVGIVNGVGGPRVLQAGVKISF